MITCATPRVLCWPLLALVLVGCGAVEARDADDRRLTVGILRVVEDADHPALVDELRAHGWSARDVRILPSDPTEVYADLDEARSVLDGWYEDGLDVLVAFSTPFAAMAAEEAPDVPTLFMVNDPEASGLVDADQRLSGVTFRVSAQRTLYLADQVLDGVERVGFLFPGDDPAVPGHRQAVLEAAERMGVEVVEAAFSSDADVAEAVDELAGAEVDAVYLANSNTTLSVLDAIEAELRSARLPAIANTHHAEFATLVVVPDGQELRRQLARQIARVLDGTSPSLIPIEDPRRFVAIVNRAAVEEVGRGPVDEDVMRQVDEVR